MKATQLERDLLTQQLKALTEDYERCAADLKQCTKQLIDKKAEAARLSEELEELKRESSDLAAAKARLEVRRRRRLTSS